MIPLDLKTGALGHKGYRKSKFGGDVVREHPVTKFSFGGHVLPFWPEILERVREAALTVTPLKYLGWDVAIGPRGAVIVEANPAHNVFSLQVAAGGLRHTAIGQAVMADAALPTGT